MITEVSVFISLILFNQKNPSLPVLMELVKFMSRRMTSKESFDKCHRRFSGFFSVTTSLTSVLSSNRTAVKTSGSSSITSMEEFFNCMFMSGNGGCNYTIITSLWQLIFYKNQGWKAVYQNRTPTVSLT